MKTKDLLDKIQIKNPCEADWNSMIGNDQFRFCEHCSLTVHDLSQMTRKRARRLVAKSNGRLCVRFQRRPDGSLITRAVPQKLFRIGRRASRIAAGAFSATLSLSSAVATAATEQASSNYGSVAAGQACPARQYNQGATIVGTLTDANGALITGAGITLGNAETAFLSGTISNGQGEYRFEGLMAGTYSLRFEAPGFSAANVGSVVLGPGTNQRVDQRLEVAPIQEVVEISGESRDLVTVTSGAMAMPEPSDPLVKAALNDELHEVLALLTRENVNVRDKATGTTALEYAVRNGNREMLQALISSGADVNSRNESKETVLMMLGEEAASEMVWDLIHAGAKVDLKDDEGDTALIEAAMVKNLNVLQALLQAGAKLNARNDEGQTALMLAAENDLVKNVKALIAAGADMNIRDNEGKTALTYAMDGDHDKVVKLLLSYGAIEGMRPENK